MRKVFAFGNDARTIDKKLWKIGSSIKQIEDDQVISDIVKLLNCLKKDEEGQK